MRLRNDVAKQSQANTERSGYITPIQAKGDGELFLILVAEIVEVPSRGQEQNSMKFPLFCTYPVFFGNKKGVELNASIYLRPSTAHNE